MRNSQTLPSRRGFLVGTGALLVPRAGAWAAARNPAEKKTVAAVVTEYRYNSHADVIVGRLLEGYRPDNVLVEPRTRIVSMYTDQIAAKDLSRGLSAKYGFPIYPSIEGALTLGKGGKLAVDAVLLVGEHGQYPTNEKGQKIYPRFELFEAIIDVYRRGRIAPLYTDKHFSYSWLKAKMMYDQAKRLGVPLMAGSSIPVTVRVPELELPLGCALEHAVIVGYGDFDAYGFHTLEALQYMVERRRGAETGIAAVEWLEGDAVWQYRDSEQGRWSAPLLNAALARSPKTKPGRPEDNCKHPVAFLLQYRDGFRAVAYMLNGETQGWMFAGKLKGKAEPVSTHFGLTHPGRPLVHFDGLVHCIEELFVTGKPLYPVERTLLTTGALSFLFESRYQKKRLETPQLRVEYHAPPHCYFERA
ncbi:MAG TPA: hypothetical protein VEU62_18280 [Bryobacterales bacterium]|nr:hypothetical protein [Bryobacterales bacterium]